MFLFSILEQIGQFGQFWHPSIKFLLFLTSEVSRLSSSMPHLIVFTILSLPNFFLYSKFCFLLQIFLLEAVYFDVSVTASDSLNKKSKPAWVINFFFVKANRFFKISRIFVQEIHQKYSFSDEIDCFSS